MKRIQTLVWGSVTTNGRKFYLLDDEPIKHKKIGSWQPEGTVCWRVCSEAYTLVNMQGEQDNSLENKYNPVYRASLVVFGKEACVELLDDPQTMLWVDYFSSDDDDNVSVSPI
jgi:hypothetical protein